MVRKKIFTLKQWVLVRGVAYARDRTVTRVMKALQCRTTDSIKKAVFIFSGISWRNILLLRLYQQLNTVLGDPWTA